MPSATTSSTTGPGRRGVDDYHADDDKNNQDVMNPASEEVPPVISLSTLESILDLETIEVAPRTRRRGAAGDEQQQQSSTSTSSSSSSPGSSNLQLLDIFRGKNLREGRFTPRTFGGQLVGQSLVAATRTVAPDLVPHSLHSYFLLPGDTYTPYIYTVERLRDGRSFAMRRVIARQKGQAVFHMSVSFQTRESGFTHQHPMPRDVPPPESVPSQEELAARYKDDPRVPQVGIERARDRDAPLQLL